MKTRKLNKIKENQVLSAIMDYLQWMHIFAFRVNNTPVYDAKRGVYRSAGKYFRKGVADILGIYDGKPLAIEVKAPTGKVSEVQKEFLNEFKEEGGIAIIAYSVDDVINNLNK